MIELLDDEQDMWTIEEVEKRRDDFFDRAKTASNALRSSDDFLNSSGIIELSLMLPEGYALSVHRGHFPGIASVYQFLGGNDIAHNRYPIGGQEFDVDNPLMVATGIAKIQDNGKLDYTFRSRVGSDHRYSEVALLDINIHSTGHQGYVFEVYDLGSDQITPQP